MKFLVQRFPISCICLLVTLFAASVYGDSGYTAKIISRADYQVLFTKTEMSHGKIVYSLSAQLLQTSSGAVLKETTIRSDLGYEDINPKFTQIAVYNKLAQIASPPPGKAPLSPKQIAHLSGTIYDLLKAVCSGEIPEIYLTESLLENLF